MVPRPLPCHTPVEQPRQPVHLPALVSVLPRKLALHPLFLTAVQTPCMWQTGKAVVTPTETPWYQAFGCKQPLSNIPLTAVIKHESRCKQAQGICTYLPCGTSATAASIASCSPAGVTQRRSASVVVMAYLQHMPGMFEPHAPEHLDNTQQKPGHRKLATDSNLSKAFLLGPDTVHSNSASKALLLGLHE